MAQQKPERRPVDEILCLVDQLSPEEQDELVGAMKVRWINNALAEAEESVSQQGTRVASDVLGELIDLYEQRKAAR